jgi:polyisoprenoid-binding protein YceI
MSRLIAFLLICLCSRLIAAENPAFPAGLTEVEFNSAKSTVRFDLGAVLHTVHGTFKVKGGNVRFDPGSGQASGQITVDVRSGETGESARDRQMQENVLESTGFPDAVFTPDRVKGRVAPTGESHVEVHGVLRIHGSEHDMTIPVTVQVENDVVTARTKFAVPYVAWGMKDPSNLVLRVNKTVEVEVALSGHLASHPRGAAAAEAVSVPVSVWKGVARKSREHSARAISRPSTDAGNPSG